MNYEIKKGISNLEKLASDCPLFSLGQIKSTDRGCNSSKHFIKRGNTSLLKGGKTTFIYSPTFPLTTPQSSHQC